MRRMLALLLAACDQLVSDAPLIAASETPAEPFAGKYQAFAAIVPREVRKVPAPYRAQCLDPGYSIAKEDKYGQPTRNRVRLRYCSYDINGRKPAPPVRIVSLADGFGFESEGQTQAFRLRRLRDGFYLAQQGPMSEEGTGYVYVLLRIRPGETESYALRCDDFPSVSRVVGPVSREVATGDPEKDARRAARAKPAAGQCKSDATSPASTRSRRSSTPSSRAHRPAERRRGLS